MVEFVRPARSGAEVQQQDESIQPVRVFALFFEDAVKDDLRGHKIPVRLTRVIRIGPRAGGEIDEGHAQLGRPVGNLSVVMFVGGQEIMEFRFRVHSSEDRGLQVITRRAGFAGGLNHCRVGG